MNKNIIITVLAIIIIVMFGTYAATHFEINKKAPAEIGTDRREAGTNNNGGEQARNNSNTTSEKPSIVWNFNEAGESSGMPQTSVTVVINSTTYDMGKFIGSCAVIGTTGGVDGKGLLAGELSAAQCWYAGGGDEIGVFANENEGYDIMTGSLSEGEEGAALFRGDFNLKQTVQS